MAEAAEAGAAETRRTTTTTPVTPDQVSALQLLVTEQARKMEVQERTLNAMAAARTTEEARVKQEMDDLLAAFDQLRAGSHGGGRGGHGRGAGGYRVPISGMKMVQCCLSNVAC